MNNSFYELAEIAGIHFMGQQNLEFQNKNARLRNTSDGFACDAQPSLITTSNAGIPAFLSTYVDPNLIDILISPMKASIIAGSETKKGDWKTSTAMFPVIESTGEVSSYGDYSENGTAGINAEFPQRQSYHYQVITQWGERELEIAGLAKIDWSNRLNISSILSLNKFQNKTYFYGVDGLQNYGLLNDPSLSAPIEPITKAATGKTWELATANEVISDIRKLYKQLQSQAGGLVDLDTKITLAMSPISEASLTKTTDFNVNVMDILKKNFTNMAVKTAPEYSTASGELLQMIVDDLEGQKTCETAFTEKLRTHTIVIGSSSFKQKKSQGTWGTIIYRPALIAQMIGI